MKRGKEMRLSGLTGLSVERLRWGLLAGALLLVGVLAVLLMYGRYRAVKAWRQIVARSGATITHETDGITWSQALGKKQIFTLHAARAIPHGEGRYTLQDGTLVLYGPNGQPTDRISGAQFEYDEKLGVAKALGEVNMDVELPKGLTGRGSSGAAEVVRVRTSGLTYVKKLGVAATDQEVEIEYEGMRGWAKGAEFDTGRSVVHLLADVRAEAAMHGAPVTLNATKADLDQDADVIDLTAPRMESRGKVATAATAVLHLRKDGSLETVEARGAVTLKQGMRTISAPSLNAAMNEDSQMEHAELAGGVALVDTSALRPMKGSAKTVRIACDGAGNPTSLVADGGAMLRMEQPRPVGGAGVSPQRVNSPGTPALNRQMGADRMTLMLTKAAHGGAGSGAHSGRRVSAVHAEGNAWASGDAVVRGANGKSAGVKSTRVAGDDLRLALVRDAAGKDEPQSLSGAGHTRIEQRTPDGTLQTSSGDALQATFETAKSGSGVEIATAEQTGHVQIRSVPGKAGEQPSEGVAERAALDGGSDLLTLSGHPRLTRGDTSVSAGTIRLMQATGDVAANGSVAATLVSANARPGAAVTHVLAEQTRLRKAAQTVEFTGTDAAPARMWQGASQVEAANLRLDRAQDAMQAWPAAANGAVRAVFAGQGSGIREQGLGIREQGLGNRERGTGLEGGGPERQRAKGQKAGGLESKGDRVVRVTSKRLDYSGVSHEAVFTGGVTADGEDGRVRAQRGVAFLTPKQGSGVRDQETSSAAAHLNGTPPCRYASRVGHPDCLGEAAGREPDPVAASVEKIVMSGAVKVQQPGRVGTGEQLLYTAATGEFVLTGTPGHPPHLVDEKQGSLTGATLLFRSPDSTIVVAGGPAARRVHTEMTIRK